MTKALITGGAGFIGLNLAQRLIADGFAVDLVDNFSRGREDALLAAVCSKPGVGLVALDLARLGATDELGADYTHIFHFAAILGVANVIARPFDTLSLNVKMTMEILRLARRQRLLSAFLFASTSEVYAGSVQHGLAAFPTTEDTPLVIADTVAPRSSYMLSKIYGEALAQHASVPWIAVRPHNIYGPRMGVEHVVPELIKRFVEAEHGSELPIYSPTHKRTFCFIDDAVELIGRLAGNPAAVGKVCNVGTEAPEYTIMQLAEIVRSAVGSDVRLIEGPVTAGSPTRRAPMMASTNELTGWHRRTALEEGVAVTSEWYLRNVFSRIARKRRML